MKLSKIDIKARIIRKLARWQKWGGSHTENILKGLPKHLIGDKIVKEVLKELIKNEWLISVRKTGEIHYYLNSRKDDEIMQFYEKYCKNSNKQ